MPGELGRLRVEGVMQLVGVSFARSSVVSQREGCGYHDRQTEGDSLQFEAAQGRIRLIARACWQQNH